VREAAIDFCKRTKLFDECTVVMTEPNIACYAPVSGWYEPERIERVRIDGRVLTPSSRADVFDDSGLSGTGEPRCYYVDGAKQIVLAPTPDDYYPVEIIATVSPDYEADVLHPALWSAWRVPIAAGARAWIRRTYATWADPDQEAIDTAVFNLAIDQAGTSRAKGFGRAKLRVRGHYC
jgi:hypothetical protein